MAPTRSRCFSVITALGISDQPPSSHARAHLSPQKQEAFICGSQQLVSAPKSPKASSQRCYLS